MTYYFQILFYPLDGGGSRYVMRCDALLSRNEKDSADELIYWMATETWPCSCPVLCCQQVIWPLKLPKIQRVSACEKNASASPARYRT